MILPFNLMHKNEAISALLLSEKITKTVRQPDFRAKIKNGYN